MTHPRQVKSTPQEHVRPKNRNASTLQDSYKTQDLEQTHQFPVSSRGTNFFYWMRSAWH